MTIEGDKQSASSRRVGVVFGALVLGAAMGVSGCSSVPDAMNPVEWYEGTLDFFTGEDEDDELATALEQPSPGENEEFPNLASVPDRPETSDPVERERVAQGLIADRRARQYADPISRQGPAVSRLETPAPLPVRTAEATGPETEPRPAAASMLAEASLPEPASGSREGANTAVGAPEEPRRLPTAPASIEAVPLESPAGATPRPQATASPSPAGLSGPAAPTPPPAPAPALRPEVAAVTPPPPAVLEEAPRPVPDRPLAAAAPTQPSAPPAPPAALPPSPANALVPSVGDPFGTVVVSSSGVTAGSAQAGSAAQSAPVFAAPAVGLPGTALPTGVPAAVPSGNSIKVATIQFAHGSSNLSQRDVSILRNVMLVHRERGGRIRIVGHSSSRTRNMDPVRHKMVNYEMSVDRAEAIARELRRLGVPSDMIVVTAQSDAQPVYYEIMPSGEAGNRRAEIYIDL